MKDADLRSVTPAELKIGMYVILPLAWFQHPFLKNQFLIESETEIGKIKELGLKRIPIDPSKTRLVKAPSAEDPKPSSGSGQLKPDSRVEPEVLITVIHDKTLPPENKSRLVRQHSITMMKSLLENPSVQNLKEAQRGISEMVTLILRDDDTLSYLLNITSHDFYTYTHSVAVGVLGIGLAKKLFKDTTNHDMRALGVGFFLHDVGKVGINPSIITKPGKLTDEEMAEMRRHPSLGFKLLHDTKQLTEQSKTIVLQHHERFDGTGYPKGLRGGDIHIYGRICSIADVYDALTSDRPYRKKMPPFTALKVMQDEMIHHFQKELFESFVLMFKAPAGNG